MLSFLFFNSKTFFLILSLFFFSPLKEALKNIKSSGKSFFLYLKIILFAGIVKTLPSLSIACIEINISLNSLLKHPAFIFSPPPTVPGIHAKNSKLPTSFSNAKSDNFLSRQALPATITPFGNIEILEKFLPNLLLYSSGSKVFIADNASTDDSISFVKMHYPQFNIIVNETNGGFSKGYNQALKEINAEYYILLNSDVDVTNEWIPPIIKLMDSDNSVAACQPKVLDFNNKVKFEYAGASGGLDSCFNIGDTGTGFFGCLRFWRDRNGLVIEG